MYKIIGGDQKEYGPVDGDQLRQWVAEGRANGQTLVQAEGSVEWKPLAWYPELAGALASSPAARAPSTPVDYTFLPADIAERDYTLDIGNCINRSWELLLRNFWNLVGITFLACMVAAVFNQLIGLISDPAMSAMIKQHDFSTRNILLVVLTMLLGAPISTVLNAWIYLYYLKVIRGEDPDINSAFSRLVAALGPLILLGFVTAVFVLLGFCACLIPGIFLTVAWAFAIPLVADKKMDFWKAMELSRKVVTRHWFVVFGLMLVAGLASVCGIVACLIGIFATLPIGLGAMAYAYEDLFGRQTR